MNKNIRIIYMGTPQFGVAPLEALCSNFNVVAVVAQPFKAQGSRQPSNCEVAAAATSLGLPLYQYDNVSSQGVDFLSTLAPDLIVTCAYGQLLSKSFLSIPRLGVLNIHASLLPRYRGASPIYSALLQGDTVTGVSIMRTVSKLDAGDVMLCESLNIDPLDNYGTLSAKLSLLGAQLIVPAVMQMVDNTACFVPQNHLEATYCGKQRAEDERIVWSNCADTISNQIRALAPSPLAYTLNGNVRLKIAQAAVVDVNCTDEAGTVIAADKRSFTVACGNSALRVTSVAPSGGRLMSAADYLNGRKISVGAVLL